MKMFFTSRAMARNVKFGKLIDHGSDSVKRWSRSFDIQTNTKHVKPEIILMACKDYRKLEQQKPVAVKIKKSKLI